MPSGADSTRREEEADSVSSLQRALSDKVRGAHFRREEGDLRRQVQKQIIPDRKQANRLQGNSKRPQHLTNHIALRQSCCGLLLLFWGTHHPAPR